MSISKNAKLKTVCVDLDGVLATYDGWRGVEHIGEPIPGAREFLSAICEIPAKVCIWTTRTNPIVNKDSGLDEQDLRLLVENWLTKHRMPFDSIATGNGKPLCAAFVDDRAVVCRPLKDIENQDFDTALRMCRALIDGHELGAQGTFSDGKMSDDDEGDMKIMIGTQNRCVRIDFGKPVCWFAFSKEHAIEFAEAILKHARKLQ